MKKLLVFLFVAVISLSFFDSEKVVHRNGMARIPFNVRVVKPLQPFSDPYVTNCGAYIISPNYPPNYAVQIQVTFDQSVPVPYYAIVSVTGVWHDQPGGVSERYFTILFPSGYNYRVQNFPLYSTEQVYTENTYCVDYGPQ